MSEFDPQVLNEPAIPPPDEFASRAHIGSMEDYETMYKRALDDPETFWAEQADLLHWFTPPQQTLEWNPPFAKWFVGGKLNVSYNCLDRHIEERGNKPALLWDLRRPCRLLLSRLRMAMDVGGALP